MCVIDRLFVMYLLACYAGSGQGGRVAPPLDVEKDGPVNLLKFDEKKEGGR